MRVIMKSAIDWARKQAEKDIVEEGESAPLRVSEGEP